MKMAVTIDRVLHFCYLLSGAVTSTTSCIVVHCVFKKNDTDVAPNNFNPYQPILVIFTDRVARMYRFELILISRDIAE